jgi:hypothetical protein
VRARLGTRRFGRRERDDGLGFLFIYIIHRKSSSEMSSAFGHGSAFRRQDLNIRE